MRRIFAGALALMAAAPAANADPLAQARDGALQCYKPDAARKTCMALAGYVFRDDGTITNNADTLLSPQPPLVMRTSSSVTIKNDAVCGVMRQEDIERADLFLNGSPLPADQAASVRAQIIPMLAKQFGLEICTAYVGAGPKVTAQVSINGTANPAFTQEVLWVKPSDGFHVAP